MNQFLNVIIWGLVATFLFSAGTASLSYAQETEDALHNRLRQENIEKFNEWRNSIPDFEKRLYDRVKGINRRVIRVQNLVIASFVLLILINYIFLALIYRRLKARTGAPKPRTDE